MKIAISGPGKAGKTTASKILAEICKLKYEKSTSEAAADVVFANGKFDRPYADVAECWADRANQRKVWGDTIAAYNGESGIRLYEDMFETHDILDGIRRRRELDGMRPKLDVVIWIHRDPVGPDVSLDYGIEACDYVVVNNGTIGEFAVRLGTLIMGISIQGLADAAGQELTSGCASVRPKRVGNTPACECRRTRD